jgi:hypothetical protein
MLGVSYDPTYPTIIDVEGLDIDFSVSNTGTTGRINITGKNHLVDVWMGTGSMSTIAYIKWLQSYVSRNTWLQVFLPDPADPMIYTLSGITTGSSISGELVVNGGIALMESTTSIYSRIGTTIYRNGLGGASNLNASGTCSNSTIFASVTDGEIYGLASSGTFLYLNLYDMNVGTTTTLYSDVGDVGEGWYSLTVIGDHGSEYLVAFSQCGIGSSYNGYARVFNTVDNSLVRISGLTYLRASYPEAHDGSVGLSYYASPQIYDGKVIYSFEESWDHNFGTPWTPPDYFHWTGLIVYDPYTGAYGYAEVQNNHNSFRYVRVLEAGMDYTSGWYYWFEIQTEPTHSPPIEEYRLYRSTVALSPSITLIENPDVNDYIKFVTGKERLYSVYNKTGNIKKTATAELVGDAPFSLTGSSITPFAKQLDETDQKIWFVSSPVSTSGTLIGISVIGESDKIITLSGGTFVDMSQLTSMNLVKDGVLFTSTSKMGLVQK